MTARGNSRRGASRIVELDRGLAANAGSLLSKRDLFTPLRIAVAWMLGTFGIYLVTGDIEGIDNLGWLSLFIVSTVVAFTLGYGAQVSGSTRRNNLPAPGGISDTGLNLVVILSGLYYVAYGLIYMRQYSVLSLSAVLGAILDPGSAYLAKFEVYEQQATAGAVDPTAQVLTLVAVLSAPLVPFLVVYWGRLSPLAKTIGIFGLIVYSSFFLAIGTLVGLGNIVLFGAAASLIVRARAKQRAQIFESMEPSKRRSRRSRMAMGLAVIAGLLFAGYMSYNQGERVTQVGVQSQYQANPVLQGMFGESFARGAAVTLYYPSHGYRGLALNLDTPFAWTEGRGSSQALDSYLEQYGLGESMFNDTYPARTEARTGWPAGMKWSTIYPWLASDLSFPGTVVFMAIIGYLVSKWWREAVVDSDPVAFLLFVQMVMLIAYIPANNQIGLSRPNLITLVCLLALYAWRHVVGATQRKEGLRRDASRHRERA